MAHIERDGFKSGKRFVTTGFRAVDEATGFRSRVVTSASQAGMIISRRFGADAEQAAFERFIAESKKAA